MKKMAISLVNFTYVAGKLQLAEAAKAWHAE